MRDVYHCVETDSAAILVGRNIKNSVSLTVGLMRCGCDMTNVLQAALLVTFWRITTTASKLQYCYKYRN